MVSVGGFVHFIALRDRFHKYFSLPLRSMLMEHEWNSRSSSPLPTYVIIPDVILSFSLFSACYILFIHGNITNTIWNILIFVFAPFMKIIHE